MIRRALFTLLFSVSLFGQTRASIVSDGSFETPDFPPEFWLFNPAGSAWTFLGRAGIIDNSTAWPVPLAIEGDQVAVLQGFGPVGGSFSQSITLSSAGLYELSYWVAGRNGPAGEPGDLTFDIFLGSTLLGTDATTTAQPFQFRTVTFSTLGPVTDNLTFQVLNASANGDASFFDAVSITAVPEPASPTLIALGWALFAMRRRYRSQR